ncbi:hypothetical protein N7523_001073 [Penicillium sp. IBT 18751x]|nr:hypothetical protein N7523_001924 [Penicillium sp. IBT 18751x]KAJ6134751.1 hypothetical protein N7523_001073 [Penicillium sp. IBT 18751x]
MLFNDWIGFLVVAGVFSAHAVNLLLPGFQGRQLEASILTQDEDVTTFVVTCPQTVPASACGIPEGGMTAVVAQNSAELRQINKRNRSVTG